MFKADDWVVVLFEPCQIRCACYIYSRPITISYKDNILTNPTMYSLKVCELIRQSLFTGTCHLAVVSHTILLAVVTNESVTVSERQIGVNVLLKGFLSDGTVFQLRHAIYMYMYLPGLCNT